MAYKQQSYTAVKYTLVSNSIQHFQLFYYANIKINKKLINIDVFMDIYITEKYWKIIFNLMFVFCTINVIPMSVCSCIVIN